MSWIIVVVRRRAAVECWVIFAGFGNEADPADVLDEEAGVGTCV